MKLFKISETNFENYDATIRNYLTKVLGAVGQQYSHSQIFGAIFDGIKGVMQNVMFYIEDALTEQNINTAVRKSSIYSLAKVSGYEPYYGSAATGLINCSVRLTNGLDGKNNKVYIKNNSLIQNKNTGLFYTLYIPSSYLVIDLSKPLMTSQIKIVQGTISSKTYVATGEPLETLHLKLLSMYDKEYIEVYVDGIKYTSAASMYDMTNNGLEYTISTGYDNELDIMFGNGIYGKQLKEGQVVVVQYITHNGTRGNIKLSDPVDFVFKSSLYDSAGNEINKINFLNLSLSTAVSGGSDTDTIDTVRKMIGYNSRSLVLANEKNFRLFFKRFSFIGQCNIWCENNSLEINVACISNYINNTTDIEEYFNAYTDNKIYLTEYQKDMVTTTLNNSNKTYAGVSLKFVDPIIYRYSVIVYVKMQSMYNKELVKNSIKKYIADYFMSLESNTVFIPKSDLITLLTNNVSHIDAVDLTFISDANEIAKYNGYYYKYRMNKSNKIEKIKQMYDSNIELGLDEYGNIKLDNVFEIPIISNNVSYVTDVEYTINKKNKLNLEEAVQVLFI